MTAWIMNAKLRPAISVVKRHLQKSVVKIHRETIVKQIKFHLQKKDLSFYFDAKNCKKLSLNILISKKDVYFILQLKIYSN